MEFVDISFWVIGRATVALIGFVSVFFINLRDAVSKIHGVKQALAWLGWCLGVRLMVSGALGFAVMLLFSVLSLIDNGRFLGPYPERFINAYTIDFVFLAVGSCLSRITQRLGAIK